MASLYKKLNNGGVYKLRRGRDILKLACCDCGMVHFIDLQLTNKERFFKLRFWRDNRATAQLRRHNYGNLQNEVDAGYKIVRGGG